MRKINQPQRNIDRYAVGLHAQKNLLEAFVAKRFFFIPFKRDSSLFHNIDPVGQFRDLRNILLYQKDGFSLFIDLLDVGKDLMP